MNEDIEDILANAPWPRQGDRLVTAGDPDWHNKAMLMHGWGDRWAVYAEGYLTAADVVVDRIKEGFGHQDFLVYPVMFMYRHSLELNIKNLIQLAWRFLDKEASSDLGSHHLVRLWQICRPLLEETAPGDSTEELGHVGTLIDEFCQYDAGSYAFRYPVTKPDPKTGERSAMLENMTEINLRNVQEVMANMSALLTAAAAQLDHKLQIKTEVMTEYRPDSGDHY
jgi:hypothetical protein